ncbi:PepSY-associated TM helix domain-containing protein [Tundrisphaera sp. TA3]|uniref:PepSY-associated TM helix domain-containing protein n=1 Tax=Tundrisphaera sp. TA3 TaxID=3435775 RepID=UPI003EBE5A58
MKLLGIKSTYKIHAWTGLIGGLLLLIVTASGSVAVFKGEIDRWANPGLLTVTPSGPRLPWDRVLESLRKACPDARVLSLTLPRSPDQAAGFDLRRKAPAPPQVFVDPYTGEMLGGRRPRGTLADYVRQFHVRLLIEGWGRIFVGVLGLALLASTVTGFIIYAPMNKKSWIPRVRRGRGTRFLLADLHKVVGMAALAFNLVFAATGAVLGLEVLYVRIYPPARVNSNPNANTNTNAARADAGKSAGVSIDDGLRAAEQSLPGTTALRVVLQPRDRLRVYLEHPITDLIKEGVSFAVYDGPSRRIVEVHDGTKAGFWARAYYACEPLHFGQFGGLLVKVIYGLAGLTAGFLSVTGYVIYAIRRRGRSRSARPDRDRRLAVTAG